MTLVSHYLFFAVLLFLFSIIPSLNNLSTIILRFWLRLQEKCSAYLDIPHIFLFVSLKILEFFMEELFRDGITFISFT